MQDHSTDAGHPPESTAAADTRERLVTILDKAAAIADRARPFVRRMTLFTALAAVWLAYYAQQLSGASLKISAALLLLLLIPAAVLGWMWWVLSELRQLPARIGELYGSLQEYAARRAQAQAAVPDSRSAGLGSLFRIGAELRPALARLLDADDIHGTVSSALVLANPLTLLVLVASLVWAFGMMGLAVLTGLLALIF